VTIRGEHVVLRPIEPRDVLRLLEIRAAPEVARWWHEPEPDWPFSDDPASTRFAILVEGEVAGLVQYAEENDPDFRHASINVFIDPELRGRGLGTDAVATLARYLIEERGHHRITIDPATDNTAAIRSYEKVGFKPVGVMHAYWRDPETRAWRDGLLMELVEA
jgi:aminoglycoside 6'-N-acetyltransferase